MSAPTPADVSAYVADIVNALAAGVTVGEGAPVAKGGTWHRQSLDEAYRWLHGAAYAQRAGGSGSSRLCGQCGGDGWVRVDGRLARCESCTPRATSDPTGEVVVASALLAKLDREVGVRLRRARDEVMGAVGALQELFEVIDRAADRTLVNERDMPRTATSAEVKAARAAQARRHERGEGVA